MSDKNDKGSGSPNPPPAPPTVDTTADIQEQQKNAREEYERRLNEHIAKLLKTGYRTASGETRKPRSKEHALFLMRAGEPGTAMP